MSQAPDGVDLPPDDNLEGLIERARADRVERTRRGLVGAVLAAIGSALAIGLVWLIARSAPSAERDPEWSPDSLE